MGVDFGRWWWDFVRIQGRFNSEKYLNILQNVLLPSARQRFPEGPIKFIHDNSSIHRAHVVRDWFREHPEFDVLPWPPKGADMNPIENIWGDIVKDMEGYRAQSADEVFERALSVWEGYKQRPDYWRKLALSITRRLQLVTDANGYWTKYKFLESVTLTFNVILQSHMKLRQNKLFSNLSIYIYIFYESLVFLNH